MLEQRAVKWEMGLKLGDPNPKSLLALLSPGLLLSPLSLGKDPFPLLSLEHARPQTAAAKPPKLHLR